MTTDSWRTKPVAPLALSELAAKLGLPVPARNPGLLLTDVKPLLEANSEHLSFFDNAAYKHGARTTRAGVVLVRERDVEILPREVIPLITPQPYVSFALALQAFYPWPVPEPGRHETAMVAESVTLHPTARLEPGVVVYPGATIGAHVHIGAHTVIGRGVNIGEGTVIGPNCTLMKTTVGAQCVIHPGVCIGQDGFGFAISGEAIFKVPQVGGVRIGNMVEIGANTTIDCGALGDTVLDDMVKIDNQVQIAHNVKIGKGSRIVAQTGISGSATLGAFTVVGGQSGIVGHIALADRVMVAARSGVTKTISEVGAVVAGVPAEPILQWRKRMAVISRLTRQAVLRKAPGASDETSGDA